MRLCELSLVLFCFGRGTFIPGAWSASYRPVPGCSSAMHTHCVVVTAPVQNIIFLSRILKSSAFDCSKVSDELKIDFDLRTNTQTAANRK